MENNKQLEFSTDTIDKINKKIEDELTDDELIILGSMAKTYGFDNVQNIVKKLCKITMETTLNLIKNK